MEELFDRVLDRTRSRLDIPALRTLFGLKTRPHRTRKDGPPPQEIVIEKPRYGLSWFRISFGRLQLKAYTKGEHVLRFEATGHNAKELRCRRSLEYFGEIITRLAGMADRFATALDCADIGFLPDGVLDELPLPAQIGTGRIAGIDLNKPRIRAALSAALALAPAPGGFTAAEHAARLRTITGHDGYTTRQAAYDLRKLRGKQLVDKPGRTRRYHVPPPAARTISALLTLRDHIIAPILAGVRSPRMGRKPKLDRRRPRLRVPVHRHADPVQARRHRNAPSRRIDNILSIRECKLLRSVRDFARKEWPLRGGPADVGRRGKRPSQGNTTSRSGVADRAQQSGELLRRPHPLAPAAGTRLCAGRRLNPLTIFWLVTQSPAPYSPQGRGSAPATSAVTTLHRSIVFRTRIDNILSMDECKRLEARASILLAQQASHKSTRTRLT